MTWYIYNDDYSRPYRILDQSGNLYLYKDWTGNTGLGVHEEEKAKIKVLKEEEYSLVAMLNPEWGKVYG